MKGIILVERSNTCLYPLTKERVSSSYPEIGIKWLE